MKINKQLFEDILSGKLKGMFVLRNSTKINTSDFKKNVNGWTDIYPYRTKNHSYTEYGNAYVDSISGYDIIDFVPETDMKENELTIEIPDGKIIDWDESKKQNKIVLKDKQLTYKDICKKLFRNKEYFYTNGAGTILSSTTSGVNRNLIFFPNNATTKHQLECILAKNQLANVAKYLNDGWKPLYDSDIFLLIETKTGVSEYKVMNGSCASDCGSIWFKSKELARQAIEILGEETVKLALEPLGI